MRLTRTAGSPSSALHRVRIVGNDGTFTAPTLVSLRLGRTSTVTVTARPLTPGLHSAILQVDDPRTAVVDAEVMLTVVTSGVLSAPTFSTTSTGSVQRNSVKRHFVTVPQGAKALQVDLSGITGSGQARWVAFDPYGVPVDSTASSQCYTFFSDILACNPFSRAYADPVPGVWELVVESRRTSPTLDNPYTLTAQALGVTVSPGTQTVAAPIGVSTPVSWTVTNDFGPVSVTPRGGSLGSALTARPTIANGATQTFTVTVPAGAERLDVRIGHPADPSADLDLFVSLGGVEVGSSADGDAEESVSIPDPAAGDYTVEVDGYDVPSGTTAYDYRDVFFSPGLGSLTAPITGFPLGTAGTASVQGLLTPAAPASAGRQLFGELDIVPPHGDAALGTGTVLVTPVGCLAPC